MIKLLFGLMADRFGRPHLQIGRAKTTIEAGLALTIVALEAEERLTFRGRARFESDIGPSLYDAVALGRDRLHQAQSPLTHTLVAMGATKGEEQRHGGIDQQKVEGGRLQRLSTGLTWEAEGIMRLPIGRHGRLEQRAQVGRRRGFEQAREIYLVAMVKVDELRDAHVGEILRP